MGSVSIHDLDGLICEDIAVEGHEWVFRFDGGRALRIAAQWRIAVTGRIALAREDHGQRFGRPAPVDGLEEANALLRRRAVVGSSISTASADLRIDFGAGHFLEVFNDSSGYEAWTLHGPNGRLVVAQGGGALVEFGKPP